MVTSPSFGSSEVSVPPASIGIVDDLQRVQKAAQKITSILDLDPLIDSILHEVTAWFGCVEASVFLHDEEHCELVMTGVCGCTAHGKGHRKKIGKEGMVGHAAAIGRMHYAPDVSKDPYYIKCEESTMAEVAIPLLVAGRLVGVFSASHHEIDGFSRHQLRLLEAFCDHIAIAIDNALRFQNERAARAALDRDAQEARLIQQALLPKSSPYIPGFVISGRSEAARAVGGDWYDFIPFPDGRWGIVLADVSGKGTAAALLMSATRGMFRSLAEACCTPGEVLTRLNELLVNDFPAGKFVTLIYGVLDAAARTLTFANAGHLQPLLIDDAGLHFLETERGLPLGLGSGDYSESQVELRPGSRLIFYSDGITEAVNPEEQEYGSSRLAEHAAKSEANAVSIVEDVRAFANGSGVRDDASVVFVGVVR